MCVEFAISVRRRQKFRNKPAITRAKQNNLFSPSSARKRNSHVVRVFASDIPKANQMAAKMHKAKAARSADKRSDTAPTDAIALLESDHREVEGYFERYKSAKSGSDKKKLAGKICAALRVHAQIEEELFYPAARKATKDIALLDEATVEHAGAKVLIAEIEAMQPGMPLYDAKVTVLGEQIQHHVKEEEIGRAHV